MLIKNKPEGTALTDSGSTSYRYLKIVRVDKAAQMSYANYGISSGYIPPDFVHVISKEPDATPPTITVDGGSWINKDEIPADQNQDELWSTNLTGSNLQTAPASFDGSLDTGAGTNVVGSSAMVWNVPVSLQSTSLEVYVAGESSSPSKGYVTFDSNPEVSISTGTSFVTNIDSGNLIGFYLSVPANTQKVYFRTGDLNKGCHLVAVKSDGKLLVDKSANDKLTKEVPYDTKLTVAGPTDLADMTGAVLMTDGAGSGPFTQTPYKLVTTDIENVQSNAAVSSVKKIRVKRYAEGLGGAGKQEVNGLKFDGVEQTTYIPLTVRYTEDGINVTEVRDQNNEDMLQMFNPTLGSGGRAFQVNASNSAHYVEIEFDEPQIVGKLELITSMQLFTKINDGEWLEEVDPTISNYEWHEVTQPLDATLLTFPGDVSTNPDLQYFKAGDVVQTQATSVVLHTTSSNDSSFVDGIKFTGYESAAIDMSSTAVQPVTNNTINVNTEYGKTYKQLVFDLLNEDGDFLFGSTAPGWATASSVDGVNWLQEGSASPGPIGAPDQSVRALMTRQPNARYLAIGNLDYYSDWSATFSVQFNQALVDTWTSRNFEQGGLQFENPDVKVISTDLVNNTMVVDGGEWAQGDVVEYQTNGGEGDIVSVNTDDNTILLSETGDRDNRWIAENKAGTDFYVAGGSKTDEPTLTADIRLECSEFSTTPEAADSLTNIVWEINGVEENAGTVNPYKPANLQPNTQYTARVKHQATKLADSEFSSSVTFTTGATRNLREYYQNQIDTLKSRLSSIEADEISDDATDTALLTLLASIATRVATLEADHETLMNNNNGGY